ncbi:M28 family peptidase [Treponema sp. OMZ 840]|uniref:M28 family peptidase n=1 Tax=Treponema sp. OMZ 840 TaxID=244313 RepID=UPI003D8A6611
MPFLPSEFKDFILPDCNRRLFLEEALRKSALDFYPITIGSCVHLCVQFPSASYNSLFKVKTVLVHYDRAQGEDGSFITPGANDNSAAVFQVLAFARRLRNGLLIPGGGAHNMRLIFTDGEELGGFVSEDSSSAAVQGAFGLASLFKKLGITNDEVYVLDGCGRGDVLAVSTAGKNSKASSGFVKRFDNLYEHTCALAKEASSGNWISVPVPYGDNAGFLACGIPAVALTVLPSDEASVYMRELQRDKNFERAVMNRGVAAHGAGFLYDINSAAGLRRAGIDPAEALLLSEKLPRTWRMMHTQFDDEASLTAQAFKIMEKFLNLLALSRHCA